MSRGAGLSAGPRGRSGSGSGAFQAEADGRLHGKPVSGKRSARVACRHSEWKLTLDARYLTSQEYFTFVLSDEDRVRDCLRPSSPIQTTALGQSFTPRYPSLPSYACVRVRARARVSGASLPLRPAAWSVERGARRTAARPIPRSRGVLAQPWGAVGLTSPALAPSHLSGGHPCFRGYYEPAR